jgi:hypothetical protein
MSNQTADCEFRPELLSRRGEYTAWGLALVVGAAWLTLVWLRRPVLPVVPILEAFLLLSALFISLGNWVDRHTLIQLRESGVLFRNGLRNVELSWPEIQHVRVLPGGWGKKVEVIGERLHFQFRTLGEVKMQGEVKGRMGFSGGDEILSTILSKSGLRVAKQAGGGVYYGRQ